MELPLVSIKDVKARLVGIPILALLSVYIYHKETLEAGGTQFFRCLAISLIFTVSYWQGNRWIWMQLLRRFPHYSQTRTRLVLVALACTAYCVMVSLFVEHLVVNKLFNTVCVFKDYLSSILSGLVPTFICLLVYESVYFFESWKQNVKKTEALARENIQSQLEALKNQLDPHFLFNSLNTLASIIDDSNTEAQHYLEQLSDVYRYVLVSREKNTVTLEEEMAFLDAYIYLNKTRFRDNLQVEKQITQQSYQQHVAPLSLQMLIENAIKHNVVSREKPLTIRIVEEEKGYLSVENNIQEKKTFEKSTKVGLQNIINRYRLLTDKQVEVIRNPDIFRVSIPLIEA
jgi:two-component system LytT family sensor kinase